MEVVLKGNSVCSVEKSNGKDYTIKHTKGEYYNETINKIWTSNDRIFDDLGFNLLFNQ